jgi:hypothetical protein
MRPDPLNQASLAGDSNLSIGEIGLTIKDGNGNALMRNF